MKPCLPLKANATGMKTKYLLRKSKPKFICIVWQTLNPNHKPLLRRGLRFWFQFCCLRFARFWFKLQNEVCDHVLSKFRHFHWIPVSPVYIHWQISTLFPLKNAITPPDPRPKNQGMILRPHHIIFSHRLCLQGLHRTRFDKRHSDRRLPWSSCLLNTAASC